MIVRLVLAVVLATTLAGCGLLQTSESSDSPDEPGGGIGDLFSGLTNTGPQWSEYLPVQNGRVCTYFNSYTEEELDRSVINVVTSEYTNVREEPDGTHFTLKGTAETTTIDESGEDETFTQTMTPEWVLANDGTLRSEMSALTDSWQFNTEDMDMSVDEFMVFPSIDFLRQGESNTSSSTGTWRATTPEAQAEFEQYLEPGESAMKFRVVYTVEGVPPKEITTPAGTFTDIVGISFKVDKIEALNANAEGRTELDERTEFLTDPSSNTVNWYARDMGVVQTGFDEAGSLSEVPPSQLQGCRQ